MSGESGGQEASRWRVRAPALGVVLCGLAVTVPPWAHGPPINPFAEEEVMRVGRRVYVSNLAWKSSWQDLKDHFRSVGEVVYSNVIKDESGELACV